MRHMQIPDSNGRQIQKAAEEAMVQMELTEQDDPEMGEDGEMIE